MFVKLINKIKLRKYDGSGCPLRQFKNVEDSKKRKQDVQRELSELFSKSYFVSRILIDNMANNRQNEGWQNTDIFSPRPAYEI